MAKSFKQLSTPSRRVEPVPTAGQDFLDLLNESAGGPTTPQVGSPYSVPELSEVVVPSNLGLPTLGGKTGELGNTAKPDKRLPKSQATEAHRTAGGITNSSNAAGEGSAEERPALPSVIVQPLEAGDARQTFVVRRHLLERMRDYVHARRAKGNYAYSQKQALEEALLEFLAAREPAQPRPPEAHEREQQFRARVREGWQSRAAGKPSARQTAQNFQESDAS
jgi:hypothetical protein